jgi:hypothetical protein
VGLLLTVPHVPKHRFAGAQPAFFFPDMQYNEPMSSPEIPSYFLSPEDQCRWNEVVAGDTLCLGLDANLDNDSEHERPGIRLSSSHDQPLSVVDPSAYQPSALYQCNPLFDASFSVPEFILALHNGMIVPVIA